MLAPPPEGTFDVDEHLPIKGGPKDGFPEQVPLLTHESLSSELNTPKQGKVRTYFDRYSGFFFFFFFSKRDCANALFGTRKENLEKNKEYVQT